VVRSMRRGYPPQNEFGGPGIRGVGRHVCPRRWSRGGRFGVLGVRGWALGLLWVVLCSGVLPLKKNEVILLCRGVGSDHPYTPK